MKRQPIMEKKESRTATPSLVTHMPSLVIVTVSGFYICDCGAAID